MYSYIYEDVNDEAIQINGYYNEITFVSPSISYNETKDLFQGCGTWINIYVISSDKEKISAGVYSITNANNGSLNPFTIEDIEFGINDNPSSEDDASIIDDLTGTLTVEENGTISFEFNFTDKVNRKLTGVFEVE